MKRTPLARKTPLRFRSKKTQAQYRERRPLVGLILAAHPVCRRCLTARSTEVHEVLSRARGGSILDPDNCVALCHDCHRWITDNPSAAREEGWLRNSWDAA